MSDRFRRDTMELMRLRARGPLPPHMRVRNTTFGQQIVTLELVNAAGHTFGSVEYYLGRANALYQPPAAARAPYLYTPTVQGGLHPPTLLIITGFYSDYEHTRRGIGSAMLRELLTIAEAADCQYILVLSGINHPVYTALGFELIDPIAETWCMRVSALRARFSPLRRAREAP